MSNSGISISGGNVHMGNVAVGQGAKAIQRIEQAGKQLEDQGLGELKQKLDALVAAISAHETDPRKKEELLDSTKSVADELTKPKPNKTSVMGVLSGIAGAIKSAAGIASAVEALKIAVSALL